MLEIFQYDFLIRAFLAGIITAVIAPMIGTFLVVRRYSLMADTLAHVSLVGIAIALLLKINPIMIAIITAIVAAVSIEKLRQTRRIFGESVLAIFLSGGLAVAIVLISAANGLNVNIFSFLFGSITTVTTRDLYTIVGVGAVVVLTIIGLYKELFFVSFNEDLAEANGLNTKAFNLLLVILAAITVSIAMRIIGVLLIGALMIIPVVTAIQFGLGFLKTMLMAIGLSLVSVIAGLFVSFYMNLATGGTIVTIALLFFIISLLINKLKSNYV